MYESLSQLLHLVACPRVGSSLRVFSRQGLGHGNVLPEEPEQDRQAPPNPRPEARSLRPQHHSTCRSGG